MALIPKKTNFRLSFRNKTKKSKMTHNTLKQRKPYSIQGLIGKNSLMHILNKKRGWTPTNFELNYSSYYKSLLQTYNHSSLNPEHELVHDTKHHVLNALPYKNVECENTQTYNHLLFGTFGFCTLNHSTLSTRFIETAKLDISKYLKKKGRVWVRVCCDTPVTARPVETRMGKGKGAIDHWETRVRPYQMIFEFSGVTRTQIKTIYNKLCKKSGLNLKLISSS